MIKILTTRQSYDLSGRSFYRYCDVVITDNGNVYQLGVGGLPLEGDLQLILDAQYDELLRAAILKSNPKTNEQVRHLLYAASWSNGEFQAAIIENMAENVGGSESAFADILEKFEAINEEWPIPKLPKKD